MEDEDDSSGIHEQYISRSCTVVRTSARIYMTRALVAALVKRTRSAQGIEGEYFGYLGYSVVCISITTCVEDAMSLIGHCLVLRKTHLVGRSTCYPGLRHQKSSRGCRDVCLSVNALHFLLLLTSAYVDLRALQKVRTSQTPIMIQRSLSIPIQSRSSLAILSSRVSYNWGIP